MPNDVAMNSPEQFPQKLIDRFGRVVDYVRISVTDRCDFRCVYCMDEEMEFLPRARILTLEELAQIGRAFAELGVRKIRLTGGEPLVRNNVIKLMRDLGELPQLRELVLTTNGSQLDHLAAEIRAAGVRRINVSLDSLDPDTFRRLTRTGELERVLRGIDAALAAGFDKIKLNAVILKGRNEHEGEKQFGIHGSFLLGTRRHVHSQNGQIVQRRTNIGCKLLFFSNLQRIF